MEDFEFSHLFMLSDRRYIYMEHDVPHGWMYTLYRHDGKALDGGYVDNFELSAYAAAEDALRHLDIITTLHEATIDITDLIG